MASLDALNLVLHKLGVSRKYVGRMYLIDAVLAVIESNEPIIIKALYIDIARKYRTSPASVDRDIRTVSDVIWRNDKNVIQKVLGRGYEDRPTNSELIDGLAFYIERK